MWLGAGLGFQTVTKEDARMELMSGACDGTDLMNTIHIPSP